MTKVVAIVQARTGSKRLPGKVLKKILGKPVLWHVISRVKAAKLIDNIVVATTVNNTDNKIIELADALGIASFAGSEDDVLDRFFEAAKKFKADVIVRITADDPLKDPTIIDKIVETFLKNKVDYVSNTIKPTYPEGIDVEVFSFSALKIAWSEATSKFDREHVTSYIWRNPRKFKLMNIENERGDLSHMRWTLDTQQDFDFMQEVFARLYKKDEIFMMDAVLELLQKHPEISRLNEQIERRACLKMLENREGD
jgi:spore coat polysaccharide biosynthesis protein SpsF